MCNLYRSVTDLSPFLFQKDPRAVGCNGNLLLDRLASSHIILVPPLHYEDSAVGGQRKKGLKSMMAEYSEKLK